MTKIMIDPPEGWRYGFPKQLPDDVHDIRAWFIQEGYPDYMVELALEYSNCWEVENENTEVKKE